MRTRPALLAVLMLCALTTVAHAQSVTIGAGTQSGTSVNGATGDSGPMYKSSATSGYNYSRYHYLYTQAELAAAGLPAGSIITGLTWFKDNVVTNVGTTDTFQIYMKNSALTAVQTPPQTFASLISGSTPVYNTAALSIPNAAGPVGFTLTTPFVYTGGAIEITTRVALLSSATAGISWLRDPITNRTIAYTFSSDATTLDVARDIRPQLQINYTPGGPCSSPPTAGTTTSSVSSAVCIGTNVSLGLTGNTFGTGQTYQLLSSPTLAGPYTAAGTAGNSPSASITATTTLYYRFAVVCGTSSDSSTPVQVVVNPAFPGGTYTINNSQPTGGSNFNTFNDAVAAVSCGISGPVVFNVANNATPYNEQIIVPQINSTSATNTITFNGNGATLNFTSSNTNQRAAITLNGADYIRIKRLNIVASTSSTYGWGVFMTNNADHNIVDSCNILVDSNATSSTFCGIVISGSATTATTAGSDCDSITITNNTINGGYYGITQLGASAALSNGNLIARNTVKNFYFYGIYGTYLSNTDIDENDIHRLTRASVSTFYGVYVGTGSQGVRVRKNRIHDPAAADPTPSHTSYIIYFSSADGTAAAPNEVSNNLIYNFNHDGLIYALYNLGSDNVRYYHNTISLDDATTTTADVTRGFYQSTAASGIELKNNIISVTRGGTGEKHAVYFNTPTTTYSARNNDYYVTSANGGGVAFYNGANYTTLPAYQAASLQDTGTVFANPAFQSMAAGNYAPTSAGVNNIGVPLPVPTDIFGAARNATTPDPGAIEFAPGACSTPPTAGVIIASDTTVCSGTTVTLDLSGNSQGQGQTYVWETSPTLAGPFTTASTSSALSAFSQAMTTTAYYRAAVTCGASTVFSDTQLVTVVQPLSGNYTINAGAPASATNFQSFGTAIQAMQCGVNGPVVVDVVAGSGPYNEQVVFPSTIAGTSATNTMTFNGNGNSLVFNSTTSAERAGILIDGADWIRINNLNIRATGTYGFGVHLTNGADNNIISGCTITLDTTSTSTNYAGMVMSGSLTSATTAGSECDSNQFLNNTIHGGYYGITTLGTSGTPTTGNVIRGNIVRNPYYYGVYNGYNEGVLIDSNSISRPTRTNSGTFYGIYNTTNLGATISRNRVHNLFGGNLTGTGTVYGLYATGDASATQPNTFVNNLVYNMNGAGTQYLIYNSGSNYVRYWHNTIASDDTTNTSSNLTRGFYQTTSASGIDIRNNIFSIRRGGSGVKTALYFGTAASVITSNYNVLYVSGASGTNNIGYADGNSYTTLSSWQQNNPYDTASLDLNPMFSGGALSTTMTPTNVAIDNLGQPIGIVQDANGAPRSLITPDMGAIEWSFIPPCVAPSALADVAAATTANISWSPSTSPNVGYEYLWSTSSTTPTTPGFPTPGSPVTIPGLTAGTTYYWFVRTVCGPNSYSAWVMDSFTTCVPPASTLIAIGSPTPNAATICQGDTALLKAPGGAGNTYLFLLNGVTAGSGVSSDSVFDATQGGSYRVVVTNATGCFDTSAAVTVTVNPLPTPSINQTNFNELTTGSFASYQWNLAGNPVPGATQQTLVASTNGSYTVTVTDANGCRATSTPYNLTTASVGGTAGSAAHIRVFPNPTNGRVFIESREAVNAQVWTLDGRKLLEVAKATSVDLSSLASGTYMLRITDAAGAVLATERVTKTN